MALDRVVYWAGGRRPTGTDLESILRRYISYAGSVDFDTDRLYVTLPGKPSRAFPDGRPAGDPGDDGLPDERWFEVWMDDEALYVITRQADDFTNDLADGFARRVARYYGAKVEV